MNKSLGVLLFVSATCCTGMLYASDDRLDSQAETRILTIQEAVQMALARSPEVLLAEAQAATCPGQQFSQ